METFRLFNYFLGDIFKTLNDSMCDFQIVLLSVNRVKLGTIRFQNLLYDFNQSGVIIFEYKFNHAHTQVEILLKIDDKICGIKYSRNIGLFSVILKSFKIYSSHLMLYIVKKYPQSKNIWSETPFVGLCKPFVNYWQVQGNKSVVKTDFTFHGYFVILFCLNYNFKKLRLMLGTSKQILLVINCQRSVDTIVT